MLTSASDDNYSSSDESELSVSWDAADEREPLPSQGTPEYSSSVTRHVENLLQNRNAVSLEKVSPLDFQLYNHFKY